VRISAARIVVLLGLPPLHVKVKAETWAVEAQIYLVWAAHRYVLEHDKEPILQMETDKIPSYTFNKTFTVRYSDRSEQENGFQPQIELEDWSGIHLVPRQMKTLVHWYMDMVQGRGLASAVGNILLYSKHVQSRILIGAIKIRTFIFYQTVKLRLKHLTKPDYIVLCIQYLIFVNIC
jgi:hypothetical protein